MKDWKIQPLGEQFCIVTSPRHGFGTDACLLAHFTAPKHKDRVCDLCSGCGVVPLLMERYYAPAQTVGVDNVCERAAVLGTEGGALAVRKQAGAGVTLALAARAFRPDWKWTE